MMAYSLKVNKRTQDPDKKATRKGMSRKLKEMETEFRQRVASELAEWDAYVKYVIIATLFIPSSLVN
jgi:hypothetical protein